MMIYVAHAYGGKQENIERAKKITHDLQVNDLENCYICPRTAFSHLGYNEIGCEDKIALCLDLLQICDKLIVVGETSEETQIEIDLAMKLKNADGEPMEVEYLEY